jgi:hypothetical protein
MRGVTLLARRAAVGFQDGVDKGNQPPQYRPLTMRPPAFRRLGTRQCLTNHSAVNSQLAHHPFYRTNAELVFRIYSNSSTLVLLSIPCLLPL